MFSFYYLYYFQQLNLHTEDALVVIIIKCTLYIYICGQGISFVSDFSQLKHTLLTRKMTGVYADWQRMRFAS